jgi:hypothetical protein
VVGELGADPGQLGPYRLWEYWSREMSGGRSLPEISHWFSQSSDFHLQGELSDDELVAFAYRQVLDRSQATTGDLGAPARDRIGCSPSRSARGPMAVTRTIAVPSPEALHAAVRAHLAQGYVLQASTSHEAYLFKAKRFAPIWALIGSLLCVIPLLIYLCVYLMQRDQAIYIVVQAARVPFPPPPPVPWPPS